MRVVIEGLSAREGGGVTDLVGLVTALRASASEVELVIVLSSKYQSGIIDALPNDVRIVDAGLAARSFVRRLTYLQRALPKVVMEQAADALLSMGEIGCWRSPVSSAVFVRNPNLFATWSTYQNGRDKMARAVYRALKRPAAKRALRAADRLIFISESFKQEVIARGDADASKSRTVHLGLGSIFLESSRETEPRDTRPYVLCVSTMSRHKNHETLIAAFAHFIGSSGLDMELLVAGGQSPKSVYLRARALASKLGIPDHVRFMGRIPWHELPALYRGASLFCLPSRLETFCHPVVEAMASGVPVLVSDLPIFREICGDAARFCDPDDVQGFASTMGSILASPTMREQMSDRGRQIATRYSWDVAAQRTVEILEESVARGGVR